MEVEALLMYWVEREYTDKKTGEVKWHREIHEARDRDIVEEGYGTPVKIETFRGNKSLNYLPKDGKPHRVKLVYQFKEYGRRYYPNLIDVILCE